MFGPGSCGEKEQNKKDARSEIKEVDKNNKTALNIFDLGLHNPERPIAGPGGAKIALFDSNTGVLPVVVASRSVDMSSRSTFFLGGELIL